MPTAGDFNADGCDTLGIYRPSNQRLSVINDVINELGQDGGGLDAADDDFLCGNPGDRFVAGAWGSAGTVRSRWSVSSIGATPVPPNAVPR